MNKKPPCADWNIWVGPEIEGTSSLGVRTLFIRRMPPTATESDDYSWMPNKSKATRVWFCKEFTNWPLLLAISKSFKQIAIEVEPKCYENIPKAIRKKAVIYLKIDVQKLKKGDFVCVGPAFSDEAFMIGRGKKVKPEEYLKDTKIA